MNILVLQLKRIGDLILTAPAIAAVRAHFPGARITVVVGPGTSGLLPAIDGIALSFTSHGNLRDLALWAELIRTRYDLCLDFTGNDRSALLTFLSHAEQRMAFARVQRSRWRRRSYTHFVDNPVRRLHTIDYHLALLAPLGITGAPARIPLHVPPANKNAARALVASLGRFAVFHPGSARTEKFWVAERWAELIDRSFEKYGFACVLTGGRSPEERAHLAAIKRAAHTTLIDLAGQIDLLTLAAVIARAALLVTVDSAPVHLAAAAGIPTVALFGPTNPFHWRPRDNPTQIVRAGQPSPLSEFSPAQPAAPMNEISTAQVFDAMDALLSAPAESRHE